MFNLEKICLPNDNYLGFPNLDPVFDCDITDFDSFVQKSNRCQFRKGIHFFIDDSKFESVWKYPDRYIDIFQGYGCIIMPDFSLYSDIPVTLQMYNKYRNHVLAKYYSFHGIKVIPNISLSSEDCYLWSILGYPSDSVVAFSALGSKYQADEKNELFAQFTFMQERLNPKYILWFDYTPPCPPVPGNVIFIPVRRY